MFLLLVNLLCFPSKLDCVSIAIIYNRKMFVKHDPEGRGEGEVQAVDRVRQVVGGRGEEDDIAGTNRLKHFSSVAYECS
jgi:hypothetical protein